MTHNTGSFVGMKFVYVDGAVTYGPKDGASNGLRGFGSILEQVFCIDGPGGEIIDRITVSYAMENECIRKIMVRLRVHVRKEAMVMAVVKSELSEATDKEVCRSTRITTDQWNSHLFLRRKRVRRCLSKSSSPSQV